MYDVVVFILLIVLIFFWYGMFVVEVDVGIKVLGVICVVLVLLWDWVMKVFSINLMISVVVIFRI